MVDQHAKSDNKWPNPFDLGFDLRSNSTSTAKWKRRSSHFEPNSSASANQ